MRCCCLREVELSWFIGIMVDDWTDEYVLMPLSEMLLIMSLAFCGSHARLCTKDKDGHASLFLYLVWRRQSDTSHAVPLLEGGIMLV